METFDVVVIGGGPAGASTALWLARAGYQVGLFERSYDQEIRAGETLHPSCKLELEKLGVWERFRADGHLPSYGNRSSWGNGLLAGSQFLFHPYGTGWLVDRRKFDLMLAEAAEGAGVTRFHGIDVKSIGRSSSGWEIRLSASPDSVRARFLVDAAGRGSRFAAPIGSRRRVYDRLVGLIGVMECDDQRVRDLYTLTEAVEYGWWHSAYLPNGSLICCLFSDLDVIKEHRLTEVENWLSRLRQTVYSRLRASFRLRTDTIIVRPAESFCMEQVAGMGWLAVGDAACAYDPLSSYGIQKALKTAGRAAEAIRLFFENGRQCEPLHTYEQEIQAGFERYLQVRLEQYGRERRWPQSVFWQRRVDRGVASAKT